MKIEEVLSEITMSQHKIEVYRDVESYLGDYLPSDTGDAPETLEVSVPCISPKVAFGAIECILGELCKLRVSEEEKLKALNAMETANGKSKRKSSTRKPAPSSSS